MQNLPLGFSKQNNVTLPQNIWMILTQNISNRIAWTRWIRRSCFMVQQRTQTQVFISCGMAPFARWVYVGVSPTRWHSPGKVWDWSPTRCAWLWFLGFPSYHIVVLWLAAGTSMFIESICCRIVLPKNGAVDAAAFGLKGLYRGLVQKQWSPHEFPHATYVYIILYVYIYIYIYTHRHTHTYIYICKTYT